MPPHRSWSPLPSRIWPSAVILSRQPTSSSAIDLFIRENGVNVQPYTCPQSQLKVLKHLIYVWHGCGMQTETFYTLKHRVSAWFAHLICLSFWPTFLTNSPKSGGGRGPICGGNGVSVQPYAHPHHNSWRCLKHLKYVWHGCGMYERFYTLNNIIGAIFTHFHHLPLKMTKRN